MICESCKAGMHADCADRYEPTAGCDCHRRPWREALDRFCSETITEEDAG